MKTNIDKITIEGKDYVPAETVQEYDGEWKIVILQRGWVVVGKFERKGNDCKLHNSAVIRKWGTTKGLPELCSGPKQDTILDRCIGAIEFDYLTVIATFSVREDAWETALR
jgi:hypothetical protein